jgi:hypothetical protein
MAEQTVLFVLQPLDQARPLAWCIVSADSEAEARHAASGQSPDHLQVDWLAPDTVECRRVVQTGGLAPPKGIASYFCQRADVVDA